MHRFLHRHLKLIAVGLVCAGIGAGAGAIAVAGASTPQTTTGAHHRVGLRALIRRTVEGQLIVATKHGFVHVNVVRGQVKSVSGQRLTLVVGTRKAAYRTVTVTLPAYTRVRDDHQLATLAQVKPGQRAMAIRAPHRALVFAHTPRTG
jgi:hypothetical protein